jgi:hypothetical protein
VKKDLKLVKFYSIFLAGCEILFNFVLYSIRIDENIVQNYVKKCKLGKG